MNPRVGFLGIAAFVVLQVFPTYAQSWTATASPQTNWGALTCSADGATVLAGVGVARLSGGAGPIYLSADYGNTWQAMAVPDKAWTGLACSADASTILASPDSGPLYLSQDGGSNWTATTLFDTNWFAVTCSADGSRLLASTRSGRIYQSTNAGVSWVTISAATGAIGGGSIGLSAGGRHLVIGNDPDYLRSMTNAGSGWTLVSSGPYSNWVSVASSAEGGKLYALTSPRFMPGEVFRSDDYGATWVAANSPTNVTGWVGLACSADGSQVLAAAVPPSLTIIGLIFMSTDGGNSWTNTHAPNLTWNGLAMSADGLTQYAAANGGFIFRSQTTPAPVLELSPSGTSVMISWLVPSRNFALQQNPDLAPGNWSDTGVPPLLDYNTLRYQVGLPLTNGALFFRLYAK